jgi:sulfhydrogenase subunit beta (sulfur reductase)
MIPKGHRTEQYVLLSPSRVGLLIRVLIRRGYDVIGPTIRDGAILYDRISSEKDLPTGWTDEQQGGKYQLKRRSDDAIFGYALGPHAWKKFLFPPSTRLWQAQRGNGPFQILPEDRKPSKLAFLGVRACELHAMKIQDLVFLGGQYVDPLYRSRREDVFVAAVNCSQAGGTCFCDSMETGPKAVSGYDLALTEVLRDSQHFLLAHVATKAGADILAEIPSEPAGQAEIAAADCVVQETAQHMGRSIQTSGLKDLLCRNLENPRWDAVADRCLSCANCTLVCPTCFCSTIEDLTDLSGRQAERIRRWDSCFTTDFSYIHGGSVRATPRAKFRQWMMHKFAYWHDQFGTSGCVGCGRCITWCPVGIDVTEEARAIRESENQVSNSV